MRVWILFWLMAVGFGPSVGAQTWARQRLQDSPRHLEWVDVVYGDRTVKCFVAYPEVKDPAKTVVLIHEIFGLTDWVRGVADQLAEMGYVAIAPDLLSGTAANGGGTAELGGDDQARQVIARLPPAQILADLDAVVDYGSKLPASNGKASVVGFCWGGSQSFRYATHNPKIVEACVFYGSAPSGGIEALQAIACPVFGFYAENDARINQTLPATRADMKAAGKTFVAEIYQGAGHGFMRAGESPTASPENALARKQAWQRLHQVLQSSGK